MTASLGIGLGGTNSDPRPRRKRSNECRFGARRRARLLMTNWCFSNKDSATTARTPPGARVWRWWPTGGGRESADASWIRTVARCRHLTRLRALIRLCEDLRIRHGQAHHVRNIGSIARQPAGLGKQAIEIDRWDRVARRERNELYAIVLSN